MTAPDDFSDVRDPQVAALVPQWLELVAERLPVSGVRPAGSSLNVLLPERLLLTLYVDDRCRWTVRVQSLLVLEELGSLGRPFSLVGHVDLAIEAGCGDPASAASALLPILDVDEALRRLTPGDDARLHQAWLQLRATPTA